jgi:hypothetical protein
VADTITLSLIGSDGGATQMVRRAADEVANLGKQADDTTSIMSRMSGVAGTVGVGWHCGNRRGGRPGVERHGRGG